ncbi:hypothetical protein QR680_006452 [Steinernema hermaphroditum]|uniref:Uncharacterized protein n=1 Tax=Steinernema hermaphroditum TaxID=289476 RepID=A0AA39HWR2_9BILA|nr:hypothetical protein QR680_006452 [Steinernema hermaphroditum]
MNSSVFLPPAVTFLICVPSTLVSFLSVSVLFRSFPANERSITLFSYLCCSLIYGVLLLLNSAVLILLQIQAIIILDPVVLQLIVHIPFICENLFVTASAALAVERVLKLTLPNKDYGFRISTILWSIVITSASAVLVLNSVLDFESRSVFMMAASYFFVPPFFLGELPFVALYTYRRFRRNVVINNLQQKRRALHNNVVLVQVTLQFLFCVLPNVLRWFGVIQRYRHYLLSVFAFHVLLSSPAPSTPTSVITSVLCEGTEDNKSRLFVACGDLIQIGFSIMFPVVNVNVRVRACHCAGSASCITDGLAKMRGLARLVS